MTIVRRYIVSCEVPLAVDAVLFHAVKKVEVVFNHCSREKTIVDLRGVRVNFWVSVISN